MISYHPLKHNVLQKVCDFDGLVDKDGVLSIFLIDDMNNRFKVFFDDYLVYRKMDEGDSLRFLNEISGFSENGNIFLYKVNNSDFVEWFIDQGYGVRYNSQLYHYVVVSKNDIIDVICFDEPCVTRID